MWIACEYGDKCGKGQGHTGLCVGSTQGTEQWTLAAGQAVKGLVRRSLRSSFEYLEMAITVSFVSASTWLVQSTGGGCTLQATQHRYADKPQLHGAQPLSVTSWPGCTSATSVAPTMASISPHN